MALTFELKFTRYFAKQFDELNYSDRDLIQNKLRLIKLNPFRFERLVGYKFVFKVKLRISDNYSRLIYSVFIPESKDITILGIFDRKFNYKDFERLFYDLRK